MSASSKIKDESASKQEPHNDRPIVKPSEDRYGVDPFAKHLAESIRKIKSPEGTVIALYGPWGSGKSSVVNLVRHHLRPAVQTNEIKIINFACWWFRGEEQLALAYFRELYTGLGITRKAKRVLPQLGARLLRAGALVGPAIDLAGGGGAGTVASGAMNWLSELIPQDETVEALHQKLADALKKQNTRFLIIIDDIDRLAPDEALLIFRLVKSVGRLPNVMYLLAFDRQLAEAVVAEKYPAEGPHYLEKIIQAGFDIPEPTSDDLRQQFLNDIAEICGSPKESDIVRFMNVFYDVVGLNLRRPRDVNRLSNAIAVTWPAVGSNVDLTDFVGIETMRVLLPDIHRTIRANKALLCGTDAAFKQLTREKQRQECDLLLLPKTGIPSPDKLRRALRRLFPPLDSIWSNTVYGNSSAQEWGRLRRICSSGHFDSYFRFSLGEDVLPSDEIKQLVARASDKDFVTRALREALQTRRSNGQTNVPLILDEINLHADNISDDVIEPFLATLFELADELNVVSDVGKGFAIGDNNLRIYWLMRRLTIDRFDIVKRSKVIIGACKAASLGWIVHLADSAFADYFPGAGKSPEPENNCLTTEVDAKKLRSAALRRLRHAARSNSLREDPTMVYLLYRWRDLAQDGGAEVKRWTNSQLRRDDMIIKLAHDLTTHGWSHSAGDVVASRTTNIMVDGIEIILDKRKFRRRLKELVSSNSLSGSDAQIVASYLEGWERQEPVGKGGTNTMAVETSP